MLQTVLVVETVFNCGTIQLYQLCCIAAQVMKFQCEEEAAVSAIEQVCSKALFLAEKHQDIFLMAAATQAQGNLLTTSG